MNDGKPMIGIENRTDDNIAFFFKRIWKTSPDLMCHARMIFDADGTPANFIMLDMNPSFEQESGLTREQASGRRFTEIFPHHDPGWIRKCGDVVRTGQTLASVEHNLALDRWYEVQVFALDSQNEFITLSRNITDYKRAEIITNRKRIEAELEQARQQPIDILESISDAFYALDHACRFTYVNTAAEKLLGKTKEELIGEGVSEAFPTSSFEFLDHLRNVIQNNEPFHTEIFALPIQKWIEVSIYPYYNGVSVYFRDITERKLMEAALRESKALYRTLFENSGDGFVLVEPLFDETGYSDDYRMLQGNPAWERQTGLRAADFIGKRIKEAMPDVEPVWPATYAEIARTGLAKHFECYNANSGRWYDQHAFLYREGQVGVFFRDITVRKQAKEALKESEERFRVFVTASFDVVYRMSPDWSKMNYLQGREFIPDTDSPSGTWLERYIHPDDQPHVQQVINEAIRTKSIFALEHRDRRVDGTLGWTFSRVVPLLDAGGAITEWFGTASDVTLRKEAEQALRASEEKFRGFIETAGEGIAESDVEGRIVFVNKQMAHMLGYNQNELLGRVELEFMAEDQVEQAYADRERIINGNNLTRESKLRHKDGSIVWTMCKVTPLYDASGQYRGSLAMHADITWCKQMEEEKQVLLNAVRKERDRLSALIRNIPDEIWFTDDRGNIIITNQSTREEFGASYLGINAAEIAASLEIYRADGSHRPIDETPLLRAVKGEEIMNLEEIIRTPVNNELRYRQANATPVRDIDGNIIGAVTITRDITEQKQAEKEYVMNRLHKISTLYVYNGDLSVILNEILELAISFTGADMGTIQLLEAESGLLRFMAHRGFEQPILEFFASVDHGTGTCGTALHRGRRVIVEDVTRSPIFAGTPFLDVVLEAGVRAVQSTPLISRSGVLVGMLSTHFRSPHMPGEQDLQLVDLLAQQAADLIERKKSDNALRESEERFSKIFNNTPDMICIIDMETDRFVDINLRFTEVLGYTRAEVIGRTLQELNHLTDSQHYDQKHEKGNLKNNETVLRSKSGRLFNVLFSSEVVEIGHRKQRITIFMDITKEKMIEAEMARLERLDLVGEMAAGIAHEIRNPMTTVRGFLQLFSSKPEYTDDRSNFDLMIKELDRANRIITEYLRLARNRIVRLQPLLLDDVVNALMPMIMAEANNREIDVKMYLNNPPEVMLDANEIRQIILNMIRNAMEAMSPRGTVTIGTMREDDVVTLFIKDQGTGISPDIIDKLGTPFLTTKDHGTGLGLAVCYSIAARHDARIDYETGTEGTTFYVRFPINSGQRLPELEESDRGQWFK